MSTRTWASPIFISRETVGSVVTAASIRFCCIAAMSVLPAPTASGVYWVRSAPPFVTRNAARKFVEEPRPVTPIRLPLRSASVWIPDRLETTRASPGTRSRMITASRILPLDCRSIVWS